MENNKEVLRHKSPVKRNVPLCCLLRETGVKQTPGPSRGLQWAAEDILIAKNHEEFTCNLPEGTRSTFLMVFSPDGKMVASTHGNHNVYVTDLTNGRSVKTLTGHPRTPWCIAFHPSSNQILASGCLGGQVRVWDLHGGSEIWTADSQTVIASLAFHPTDRVLVIASYNEIHFWDWSQQKPFAKCCTANEREKVRYVAFDGLGEKLVTGIANAPRIQSQWDRVSAPQPPPILSQAEHERRITICYRYMVEQYEQLVERYYRLSNSSPRRPAAQPPTAPSRTDRGTDPMVPADGDSTNRCILCRRTTETQTSPSPPPGPSTSDQRHNHSTGTDEISASHSSSEFMPERNDPSLLQGPLTMRASYLYERLARLRSQVETGRTILARTRSAAAAMSARMSPSAPEDANYLIDTAQTRPNAYVIDFNTNRNSLDQNPRFPLEDHAPIRSRSPPSHHYMLPEPLLPDEDEEERPSFISRISSFINRRRAARLSDSSSSDTSISDNVPTWQRPLTPPPPQSQRLTNLNCPSSRRVIFDQVETPPPPPAVLPNANRTPQNNSRRSLLLCNISGTSASTSLSSRSMSEPTNGSDSDADNVFLRQDMDNNFSHWRVFLRYRYFRDSGSNTEPPSESNSSDSNSSRLRRNSSESSSAIARLRAQFRRLQSVYNNRDREPHLLREAAENAERRLLSRLTNLLERPFPSTSSSTDSPSFQPPQGSSTDLASVRFGIELLGRHIENLSNQCSRVRLENSAVGMRRLWETLESQIFALHGAVRDWPPVVRVSPGNQVDTEGVASTSSLPTDEESEDSVSTQGRRHLGPRRFRFLHRPAYKRPRFDRNFRIPRRNNQGTSPDDDSDDNDEGGNASRQSESSDTDSRGVKRKLMCDPSPPAPPAPAPASTPPPPTPPLPSTNDTTPRGSGRVTSRSRVTSRNYSRARSTFSIRPWLFSRERTSVLNPSYNTTREREAPPEGDFVASRTRSATSYHASRDALRHRARHVLLLMVDSLTQFFENDTFTRPVTNETLQQRITNLVSLLELALSLTDLLLTQLDVARETGNRRPSRGQDSAGYRAREEAARRRANTTRRFASAVEDASSFRPNREEIIPPGRLPPILRVNDGPVPPDPPPSATLRESPPLLPPTFRQRYLHPRYRMPILIDDSSEESSHDRSDLFFLRAHSSSVLLSDTPMAPHHRIQAWDFTKYKLPEIHLAHKNIVVTECKVHNDASVDISNDGKLLVTLLPSGRLSITTMLGVYSMQWESLGQCLYTTTFDQNAVSVSLSPTTRHLIVGLASRRVHFFHTDRQTIAQIFKMEGGKPSKSDPSKGRLVIVRELEMSRESTDFMSLNCIRWAPTPGEAFVYGTNTGKLKILR